MKADTKTATGIFLPDSAVKELNEAKVLAVGPGAVDKEGKRIPMGVAAGDKVLIPQVGCTTNWRVWTGIDNRNSLEEAQLRSARRSTLSSGTMSMLYNHV